VPFCYDFASNEKSLQSLNVGGLPFDLLPNAQTAAAMKEANEIIKNGSARFNDAESLLQI
jgi:antitoxin component of RelBE/YafQ-DinJ toxin-antitoxin module